MGKNYSMEMSCAEKGAEKTFKKIHPETRTQASENEDPR